MNILVNQCICCSYSNIRLNVDDFLVKNLVRKLRNLDEWAQLLRDIVEEFDGSPCIDLLEDGKIGNFIFMDSTHKYEDPPRDVNDLSPTSITQERAELQDTSTDYHTHTCLSKQPQSPLPAFHDILSPFDLPRTSELQNQVLFLREDAHCEVEEQLNSEIVGIKTDYERFQVDLNTQLERDSAVLLSEHNEAIAEIHERYQAISDSVIYKSNLTLDQLKQSEIGHARLGDDAMSKKLRSRYTKLKSEFEVFEKQRLKRQEEAEVNRVGRLFKSRIDKLIMTKDIKLRKYTLSTQEKLRSVGKRARYEKIHVDRRFHGQIIESKSSK